MSSIHFNNTYFTLNSQETNTCVWFVGPGCRPALSIRLQSILSTNKYAYSYVYAHIKYIHTKHTQWKKWAGSQTPASKETWQCLIFWIQCMSYVVFRIWDNLIICYVWSLIKHNKWLNKGEITTKNLLKENVWHITCPSTHYVYQSMHIKYKVSWNSFQWVQRNCTEKSVSVNIIFSNTVQTSKLKMGVTPTKLIINYRYIWCTDMHIYTFNSLIPLCG